MFHFHSAKFKVTNWTIRKVYSGLELHHEGKWTTELVLIEVGGASNRLLATIWRQLLRILDKLKSDWMHVLSMSSDR